MAILKDQIEVAILLVDYGAPLGRWDESELSPLEYAIIGNQEEMISLLLSHNASVSDTNPHGFTPLMISIIYNNPSAASLLLWYGADPDALVTGYRTTGEQLAMDMGREEISQIIFSWKYEIEPSMFE
ncbi:unnamed protein product [Rodentolepis nana]|uniref:ANK_REP_REGION domain-containing protein n=1 Tax=Rodentolepis nana TaxID=102285 RepID=A0A0R3TYK2_RODNA|nr:unnamed protein product [Rodentolepis nana]